MNSEYLNKITNADCLEDIPLIENESIDSLSSDLPYGICLYD